jgi:cytochrome bd ubiquinol oxidase subunit I
MHDAIDIPDLGSLILTHSWNGEIKGLKEWPPQDRPPVAPPFYAFRIMVGIAIIMLAVAVIGQILQVRGRLFSVGWLLRLCEFVAPLGFVAVVAGWITTEVGRQPWTVYGLLRTADSVSPSLTGADVAISLALYIIVYLLMFPTGIAFMAGIVRRGVDQETAEPAAVESGRPRRAFQTAARPSSDT